MGQPGPSLHYLYRRPVLQRSAVNGCELLLGGCQLALAASASLLGVDQGCLSALDQAQTPLHRGPCCSELRGSGTARARGLDLVPEGLGNLKGPGGVQGGCSPAANLLSGFPRRLPSVPDGPLSGCPGSQVRVGSRQCRTLVQRLGDPHVILRGVHRRLGGPHHRHGRRRPASGRRR